MNRTWLAALRCLFLLGPFILVAVTLFSGATSRHALATTGPKFSLHIHGTPCDPYYGPSQCNIYPGSNFSVDVFVDKRNLPDYDGDTIGGYIGFQARVASTPSDLPYQNAPGLQEINGYWPPCVYPFEDASSTSNYLGGCISDAGTPGSTYAGVVMQVTFRCDANPTQFHDISLVQGGGNDTVLIAENFSLVTPESPAATLSVRCHWLGLPATSTPTRTPTRTPTSTPTIAGVGGIAELARSDGESSLATESRRGVRYVWAFALLGGGLFVCAGAVVGVRLLKRAR